MSLEFVILFFFNKNPTIKKKNFNKKKKLVKEKKLNKKNELSNN